MGGTHQLVVKEIHIIVSKFQYIGISKQVNNTYLNTKWKKSIAFSLIYTPLYNTCDIGKIHSIPQLKISKFGMFNDIIVQGKSFFYLIYSFDIKGMHSFVNFFVIMLTDGCFS